MRVGEQMARMGEYAVSRDFHGVLVALGLGSCIGLALVDRRTGVAGLAHIVLPDVPSHPEDAPVKYAPTAVPFLIERVIALGARRSLLQAVIVGGASMFETRTGLEIGQRNELAVVEALGRARIPVSARATSGKRGRTVRVYVGEGRVAARAVGAAEEDLLHPRAAGTPA